MLHEKGVVEGFAGPQKIWITTQVKTSCGQCQQKKDCGTGIIAQLMTTKTNRVMVKCDYKVELGDTVTVAIPEQNLVWSSILLYLLPLVGMFVGLVIANLFSFHELIGLVFALSGIISGLYLANFVSKKIKALSIMPKVVETFNFDKVECSKD